MTIIDKRPAKVPAHRLASIADAADYAACPGKTIRRRIADGTIPADLRLPSLLCLVELTPTEARPAPLSRAFRR